MSDSSALRFLINSGWEVLNIPLEFMGYNFTFGQLLVFTIAIVIVGLIVNFFA